MTMLTEKRSNLPTAARDGGSDVGTRRRRFLGVAAGYAGAGLLARATRAAVPGAGPAGGRVTLAGIGVGGIGGAQLPLLAGVGFEVAALCDLDDDYAGRVYQKFPGARRYRDFRELLAREGDKIDAIYIGTPDHTHAIVALEALRLKKPVLCVKPLARTIEETRAMVEASRRAGVATQMTASTAVMETGCRTCEILWDGVIGDVGEVHIWSDRPLWPQGMTRPRGEDPIPAGFDWDLWLGPAPRRPFKARWSMDDPAVTQIAADRGENRKPGKVAGAVYHPWNFRGWHDFGTGALGDMGCHHFNIPRRALKLGHPLAVSASCTRRPSESWPLASIVTWEYPAREGMVPVKVVWYDGGLRPPRPAELEPGKELGTSGILYIGSRGKLLAEGSGGMPSLIPEARMRAYQPPAPSLPRRPALWQEWIDEIRGGERSSESWAECAGPLTEMVLLGNIAVRIGSHLRWDGPNMRFLGNDAASALIQANYQNGWSLRV